MPTGVRVDVSLEFPNADCLAGFEQALALSGLSLEGYLQQQIALGLQQQAAPGDCSALPVQGDGHG